MSAPDSFQLSADAAEIYETRFVPALFAKWAPPLVEAAGVVPGQTVLDVPAAPESSPGTSPTELRGRDG